MIAALLTILGAACLWLVRHLAGEFVREGLHLLFAKPKRRLAGWLAQGHSTIRLSVPLFPCLVLLGGGLLLFLRSVNAEVVGAAEVSRGSFGLLLAVAALWLSLWLNDAWKTSRGLRRIVEQGDHRESVT